MVICVTPWSDSSHARRYVGNHKKEKKTDANQNYKLLESDVDEFSTEHETTQSHKGRSLMILEGGA